MELAGGTDIFPELKTKSLAKERIIYDHQEIINRNPDIILASWCGKKLKKDKMISRDNWIQMDAVIQDHIYEIKSAIILQPGPTAIMKGLP